MRVSTEDLYHVIAELSPSDRQTVYDLAQFLRARHQQVVQAWRDLDAQEPDREPVSLEEAEQLRDPEFVEWDPNAVGDGV
jgi:CO dehydrogenase/acetyl-CoA synthase beta subunit